MIYVITKTSAYGDEKPCEEAKKRIFERWHTRTCSEDEFNEKFSDREGLWRSKGKNHTITKDGYITRQEDDEEAWSIEINTLDDLQKLIDKYGSLIIFDQHHALNVPYIEIYDSYRE
jgi:hypothetical protein